MIKTIFMDYTGTMIQEKGKDLEQAVCRIWKNSRLETPEETVKYWWDQLKIMEEKSYGDSFLSEDEIVSHLLKQLGRDMGLEDDFTELHRLIQRFWMYAPVFDDVREFLELCPVPVYIITNNGVSYVEECLKYNGLTAAGIISGEMVRAYKPHREIFDYALQKSGCGPEEVLHIGDSAISDVKGAAAAGITPVLLDRQGKAGCAECAVIHRLPEVLEYLKEFC